jgi:hypothetical protein
MPRLRVRRGARHCSRRAWPSLLAIAVLGFGTMAHAHAQSMEPLSYTNAPIGLNFLIVGTTHQWGSVLVDPTSPVKDVEAKVDAATLAYMRVFDFWGQSGSLAMVVPNAWLSASGEVFDQARSISRTGLADITARLSINLFGAPALTLPEFARYQQDTIVGVTLLVTAPTGQYDPSKLVNIGTNRWSFKPEVGVSKALGPWTLEAAAGVTFFTDNDQFFGNGVRQQDPLYSVQGHAIYNLNPRLWAALDATYYTGGDTTLNGIAGNDRQNNTRWGATLAYSLDRQNSIKGYYSSGVSARVGTEFQIVGLAWQYRWGAGL